LAACAVAPPAASAASDTVERSNILTRLLMAFLPHVRPNAASLQRGLGLVVN
jgi:hypothetical protein